MEFLSDTDDDVMVPPLASQYEYAVTEPAPPVYTISSDEGEDSTEVADKTPLWDPTLLTLDVPVHEEEDSTELADMTPLWDPTLFTLEAPEYENYDELQFDDPYEQWLTEEIKIRFLTRADVLSKPSNVLWHYVKRGIRSPMRPPDATTIERVAVCLQASTEGTYELPVCYVVLQYRVDDTVLNAPHRSQRLRGTVYVTKTGSRMSSIYPGKDDRYAEEKHRRLWEVLFARIEATAENGTYDTDRVAFSDVCILPAAKFDHYAQTHGYVQTRGSYTKRCRTTV
jgi:hypothetical protein